VNDGGPPSPTDETAYVGSAACRSCHADVAEDHDKHGHAHILQEATDRGAVFPAVATRAGVSTPPPGLDWVDVSYVLGGYAKAANFVSRDGFVYTIENDGAWLTYTVPFQSTGSDPGYPPVNIGGLGEAPLSYECLRCHVTGGLDLANSSGQSQDGRPGIEGTWKEAGVQCEACHGPGAVHVGDPTGGHLIVDGSSDGCASCHANPDPQMQLAVEDGYLIGYQQVGELAASPHAELACSVCHDPHVSTLYVPERGIRNDCLTCHPDQNMAGHDGSIFIQGDYVETLSCVSCHMGFASRNALAANAEFTGDLGGRIGDTRTHIFRINSANVGYETTLTEDGQALAVDEDGQASLTLEYACLRCHNGFGSAPLFSLEAASLGAVDRHQRPELWEVIP
jgi:hypothetical protein